MPNISNASIGHFHESELYHSKRNRIRVRILIDKITITLKLYLKILLSMFSVKILLPVNRLSRESEIERIQQKISK